MKFPIYKIDHSKTEHISLDELVENIESYQGFWHEHGFIEMDDEDGIGVILDAKLCEDEDDEEVCYQLDIAEQDQNTGEMIVCRIYIDPRDGEVFVSNDKVDPEQMRKLEAEHKKMLEEYAEIDALYFDDDISPESAIERQNNLLASKNSKLKI